MILKHLNVVFVLFFSICTAYAQQYGWFLQYSSTTSGLSRVDFINTNTGWIAGYGTNQCQIFRTTNGGNNWQLISNINNLIIRDIDFINAAAGWVCGYDVFDPRIYRSTNGGNNWTAQAVPLGELALLYSIKFINDNLGFCGGELGTILRTTNGGTNWILYPNQSEYDFIDDIFFINAETGWMAGGSESGCLYKTTNSGINWSRYGFSFMGFNSICFFDSLRGWAVGSDGMLHGMINKTTNSGINWSGEYISSTEQINSVWFLDTLYGRMTSTNTNSTSTIYVTTNSGNNWNNEFSNSLGFGELFFVDPLNGWVIGGGGNLFKYGDITGVGHSNKLPNHFSLSQNYPNPFNPTTKIKFSIPPSKGARGMSVRLIIYDILGRLVASLIPPLWGGQEGLKPGAYEVEFDGTNYPSGVYFYQLRADEFMDTKKLILMK